MFERRLCGIDSGKIEPDGKTYRRRWLGIADWRRADTNELPPVGKLRYNTDSEDDYDDKLDRNLSADRYDDQAANLRLEQRPHTEDLQEMGPTGR